MLTGLKLLSFASKCVFCRPELNAKRGGEGGGGHGTEF